MRNAADAWRNSDSRCGMFEPMPWSTWGDLFFLGEYGDIAADLAAQAQDR